MRKIICFLFVLSCSLWVMADDDLSPNGKEPKPKSKAEAEARQRLKDIMEEAFQLHCQWGKNIEHDDSDSINIYDYPVCQKIDDLDRRYCSDDWNKLKNAVDSIDSKLPEDEQGYWDAGYWIKGQGVYCCTFGKIVKVKREGNNRLFIVYSYDAVESIFEGIDESGNEIWNDYPLVYYATAAVNMVYERGNWYIDDFYERYEDEEEIMESCKIGMKAYLNNPY